MIKNTVKYAACNSIGWSIAVIDKSHGGEKKSCIIHNAVEWQRISRVCLLPWFLTAEPMYELCLLFHVNKLNAVILTKMEGT